ncbi:MAG: 2-C-methyl-D-erythritol 2,4-cyclodiphosphate synthase [Deferribacterota bacterium]|nr:2-C-methyl-D-erythritol 2,4-cyclodiphosphate synthase [Deferribacterota bacterium]
MKIGIGYDSHRFVKNKPLILGGIRIEHDWGLEGHSDGDVIVHAIIDSLVSPTLNKNIGELFPDNSPEYKNICSLTLLKKVHTLIVGAGYNIINTDVVFISETPKISPYTNKMKEVLAHYLVLPINAISIKGKSNENMGFIGRLEGAAAIAVSLLRLNKNIS